MRSITLLIFCLATLVGFGLTSRGESSRHDPWRDYRDPLEGDKTMTRLVCERPAVLKTCLKTCDCPGDTAQPDCGDTTCHQYCRCREKTPPPSYKKDPPSPPKPPRYDPPGGSGSGKKHSKKKPGFFSRLFGGGRKKKSHKSRHH